MRQKTYVTPAIETLETTEILEMIGPVQGYGPGSAGGFGGGRGGIVTPPIPGVGSVTPSSTTH